MKRSFGTQSGFTLLELMVGLAIVAVLGAVAVVAYMKYSERAQGVDIIGRYDAIRTGVAARAQSAKSDDCAELAKGLDTANLSGSGPTLAYGFEAVAGGYRPVLTVCAQAGTSGPKGVATARGAYETLAKSGVVEKNAVVTDSVVSFAVRLTDGDAPLCRSAPVSVATTCGQPRQLAQASQPPAQAAQPPAQASTLPAQPAAQPIQPAVTAPPACPLGQVPNASGTCVAPAALLPPVPQPRANQPAPQPVAASVTACPAGQEKVLITSGAQPQSACAPGCQSGERRNTAGFCIRDVPPPVPTWAATKPDPGTPPPPAQPGQLPTCASGTKLVTTFVRGVLTNTCVADACPSGQRPDGSGQCVARCTAPLIWDQLLNSCIDKTSPPACPGGLSRSGDGQCTCSSGVLPEQDGSCKSTCDDTYGPTCDLDFGLGMCGEAFVQEMCKKFCGICTADGSAPPKRGTGGAPVMPAVAPWLWGVFPSRAGDTVVLDDTALIKLFGVVSPDGSPVSITKISTPPGYYSTLNLSSIFDIRRRDDGRWQIAAIRDPGPNFYFNFVFTFTNGVGSTESGSASIASE